MMIVVPPGVPKSVLTQKCDDVINTQQAERYEWNETRDLLGFNIELADSKLTLSAVAYAALMIQDYIAFD